MVKHCGYCFLEDFGDPVKCRSFAHHCCCAYYDMYFLETFNCNPEKCRAEQKKEINDNISQHNSIHHTHFSNKRHRLYLSKLY